MVSHSFVTWFSIHLPFWVLHGSVVKCLTRNQGVMGSSCIGSFGFFVGESLGKTLQSSSLVLMKPKEHINNVSCRRDMTEIMLNGVKPQSVNHLPLLTIDCMLLNTVFKIISVIWQWPVQLSVLSYISF